MACRHHGKGADEQLSDGPNAAIREAEIPYRSEIGNRLRKERLQSLRKGRNRHRGQLFRQSDGDCYGVGRPTRFRPGLVIERTEGAVLPPPLPVTTSATPPPHRSTEQASVYSSGLRASNPPPQPWGSRKFSLPRAPHHLTAPSVPQEPHRLYPRPGAQTLNRSQSDRRELAICNEIRLRV